MDPSPQAPGSEGAPTAAAKGWSRWLDGGLLLGVGLFLAYRFVGTGAGNAPEVGGVAVLPPGDRPSFVELSGTR